MQERENTLSGCEKCEGVMECKRINGKKIMVCPLCGYEETFKSEFVPTSSTPWTQVFAFGSQSDMVEDRLAKCMEFPEDQNDPDSW